MQITIPATPAGHRAASCWRKTITGLGPGKAGTAVVGDWLTAGDQADIPTGTLIVAVDKTTTGWAGHYRTGESYAVEDAAVTLYLVTADGLTPMWARHYKSAASAFGATTVKKITALLAAHPAPAGVVTVLAEARRPNTRPADCRWCRRRIPTGLGHVVGHGPAAQVEHHESCPNGITVNGTPCARCGVGVVCAPGGAGTETVLVREGTGRWETRHVAAAACTTTPVESWDAYQERIAARDAAARAAQAARLADHLAQEQNRAVAAARIAKRKTEKAAANLAAYHAEQARVAGLTRASTTETTLHDKGIGGGMRVSLVEYADILSDATTTKRWGVREYASGPGATGYGDYDPDLGRTTDHPRIDDARADYRSRTFTAPAPVYPSQAGGRCDNCDNGGARYPRRDSSGIPGMVCTSCNRDADYELSFS